MSLIESALARAKALGTPPPAAGQKPDRAAKSRTQTVRPKDRAEELRAAEPAERIVAAERRVDRQACATNRVLLEETRAENAAASAAYRILRARLLRRARTNGWTSVGVTSAMPNDGKSLTALNLAISLAREGNSDVTLIDLDLRDPSICKYLGVTPPANLQDYFQKRARLPEVFFTIGVERLMVAAATAGTDRASELLASSEFDELIRYVTERSSNPLILIDLPPVLVTDDVLVVAPRMDALLFVSSEGRTHRADVEKALGVLNEFAIAGVVLNRAVETGQSYGYGYGYGYGLDEPGR